MAYTVPHSLLPLHISTHVTCSPCGQILAFKWSGEPQTTMAYTNQLYKAIVWLENEDWIRRNKGKYYVNPMFFWRGRLDKYSAAFEIALRNYKEIGVTKDENAS